MKQILLAVVCWLTLVSPALAQRDADERYIGIYSLIQQATAQLESGEPRQALVNLTAAQAQLVQFQRGFPNWNPIIVNFRLADLAKKIADTSAKVAALAPPPTQPAATGTAPVAPKSSAVEDSLRIQLQAMETENRTLQAKLKEALSSLPVGVDSNELVKAQEEIRSLMKLNDLLKASAAAEGNANNAAGLRRQLDDALDKYSAEHGRTEKLAADNAALQGELKRLTQDAGALDSLRRENERLKAQAVPAPAAPDNKQAAQLKAAEDQIATLQAALKKNSAEILAIQRQLAESQNKATAEQGRADQLAADNAALQRELKQGSPDVKVLDALRRENELLKSRLAAPSPAAKDAATAKALAAQVKDLNAQIASLQSSATAAQQAKGALEEKVRQMSSEMEQLRAANVQGQIRDLTKERDELVKKLARAEKKNARKQPRLAPDAQASALTNELATLRARLEVAEAKPVPYSPEELALFRAGAPQPKSTQRPLHELPSGTSELVVSAQRHFANHELDAAEADYQKILERDQNNGLVLANMATIELQANKLAEAEKHILAALAQAPEDAYNLSTLGFLRYRQEKYDEALDVLSRAAKLDPNNPEIQNHLGVTLSHKGLRVQAETALRKAVQLNPAYAPAHNNLAVVYLNQTPSMPMLARWHYEKAVAAGQPRNTDLEQLLAAKGAPYNP